MSRLFKKFAKYILLPIIGILLLILLSIVSYRWYLQSHARDANKIISPSGIESLEKIKIGGIEQWIYIRGEDKTKPLLLFLHGGPGSPEMPFAQKKFQGNLERAFVVVHWDQRGAGKSYSSNITADQLQIENFITDTKELTQILLGRFKQPRLFLVGHSWGSVIGLNTINRYPDYYYAYVGIGQVADMQAGESLSYKFVLETARKRKNQVALQELLAIGEPPYKKFQDLGVQRKWLSSFGGSIYGEKNAMLVIGREYFQFPDYSLIDLIYRFPMGAYTSLNTIWKELEKVKPIKSVPSSKVPLYFLTGRHDYTVPFELTEKLFRKIKAPHKKLIWFEQSAHSPNYEEPDKFYKVMVNQVLKETL